MISYSDLACPLFWKGVAESLLLISLVASLVQMFRYREKIARLKDAASLMLGEKSTPQEQRLGEALLRFEVQH